MATRPPLEIEKSHVQMKVQSSASQQTCTVVAKALNEKSRSKNRTKKGFTKVSVGFVSQRMVVHKYATKTSPTQSKHLLRKLRAPFARVVCVPPFRGGNTKFFSSQKQKCPMPKIATGMTTCSVNKTAPTQVRMHGAAECSGLPSFWSGAIATSRDHSRTLGETNPAGGISPSRASRFPRHKRADGQPGPLPQAAYSEDLRQLM